MSVAENSIRSLVSRYERHVVYTDGDLESSSMWLFTSETYITLLFREESDWKSNTVIQE